MTAARYCRCGAIIKHNNVCAKCKPTTAQRGYDWAWQKLRERILDDAPLCEICDSRGLAVPAVHVHHMVPIAECSARRLDPTNLQPLCEACHVEVHGGEVWKGN